MRLFLILLFAGLGALIGIFDPSRPEHMSLTANGIAGAVAGLVTLVFFACLAKQSKEHEEIGQLMTRCYLGTSLENQSN